MIPADTPAAFHDERNRTISQNKKIKLTRFQIIGPYMAIGGVPNYLKQSEPGLLVAQIIDKTGFTNDGNLLSEYGQLYVSLFGHSHYHQKIVELLAKKRKGLSRNELLDDT